MYSFVWRLQVCNEVIVIGRLQQVRLDQSVEHKTSNLRPVGSSATVGKKFSFCILSLSTCFWQVDWSHANEIKHDVHSRYICA